MTAIDQIEKNISQTTDQKLKVDLLNQFGFNCRNTHPKEAFLKSEEALIISKKLNYKEGEAASNSNLGFLMMHEAKNEHSFSYLLNALSIYEELNNETGIAAVQYNLAVLNIRMGNFDQAIGLLHKSLSTREKQNDRPGMASCYFQLTYLNQHFNDLDSAFENANKTVALRKETNDAAGLGAALMVLGDVYIKRKELEKAKEIIHRSLELRKASGEKIGYFVSLIRWVEIHIELKEYDKAKEFAKHGLTSAIEEDVKFGILRFRQVLGKIEVAQENWAEAKIILAEAIRVAEEFSFKSVQFELLESMTKVLKAEGNYKEAFEHFEKFHKLKEEVISMQNNMQLKSVQLINQIEFAKKEAEIEKTKNTELQKAYSIIEEKNKEVEEKQKEILDSIHYARRIQTSLLPTEKYIERILNEIIGHSNL